MIYYIIFSFLMKIKYFFLLFKKYLFCFYLLFFIYVKIIHKYYLYAIFILKKNKKNFKLINIV